MKAAPIRYRANSHWHDMLDGPCECGAWHHETDPDHAEHVAECERAAIEESGDRAGIPHE